MVHKYMGFETEPVLKIFVLIFLIALLFAAYAYRGSKVETKEQDSSDAWATFPQQGIYCLAFYRQSGNFHKKLYVVNGNKETVEAEIKKVFSRAKIDGDYMVSTRGETIVYERAYPAYSPRGKRYSKGVGSCHVYFITDAETTIKKTVVAKNIRFESVAA